MYSALSLLRKVEYSQSDMSSAVSRVVSARAMIDSSQPRLLRQGLAIIRSTSDYGPSRDIMITANREIRGAAIVANSKMCYLICCLNSYGSCLTHILFLFCSVCLSLVHGGGESYRRSTRSHSHRITLD